MQVEKNKDLGENKMGIMPINKLLITMSLPIMMSMLVQALYNVVDSIFVARISEDALTAVSLAFPMQALMIAIGSGTSVGINAVLSKSLGEKNQGKVNKTANNGIFLAVLCYIVFLLIGIFVVGSFYYAQTDNEAIIAYGKEYLTIICSFSLGIYSQMMFERLLQSTGRTFYAMLTQGAGAITNLILDPILIFGLFGMPKLGVAGAAIATVIGQSIAAILALILNIKKNEEIKLSLKGFTPDFDIIKQIYAIGIPSIIVQVGGSIMVFGMNQILIAFSSTATALFGVYYKLQSFIFMPIFGLTNGMMPIVAYNFGAGKRDRVVQTVKLGVIYATAIMTLGFLSFQIFPEALLAMFNASEVMMSIGVTALRIVSISFLFAGFCIICGMMFSALAHGTYGMIVSTARQLVVLLPVAYLLSLLGEVGYVWWSYPIAEIISFVLTIIFLIRINKKVIRNIGKPIESEVTE